MRKIFFLAILIFTTAFVRAQTQGTVVPPPNENKKEISKKKFGPKKDGYLSKEVTEVDTVVPYSVINDEDKAFVKRVWREIDLRDRGNSILASPKVNLVGVIFTALNNGELDMYGADDEDFKGQPVSAADSAFLGVNQNTNELNRADNEFFAANYTIIRIKEDWVLDIKRGIFEPRIVGIAPVRMDVKTPVDNNGLPLVDPITNTVRADTLKSVAGWFYFDDLREVLVKTKIVSTAPVRKEKGWLRTISAMRAF